MNFKKCSFIFTIRTIFEKNRVAAAALFLSFPARRLPLQACEGRKPNGKGEMNGGWHLSQSQIDLLTNVRSVVDINYKG